MRITPLLLIAILGTLFTVSCSKDMTIGSDLINSNANITFIDTSSVLMSTMYVDSVVSSEKKSFLVGNYGTNNTDTLMGSAIASCFVSFASPAEVSSGNTSTFVLNQKAVFDSITLQLKANTDYYGDTLKPQNISVYRLLKPVKYRFHDNSYYPFYNTSKISYDSVNVIGSKYFARKPLTYKKHEIRLDDSIGTKIFNVLQSKVKTALDGDLFRLFFPGLVITSGYSNSSLSGFYTDSTKLRLYCHVPTEGKDTIVNLSIATNSSSQKLQFNRIQFNRKGTKLANLNSVNKEISSVLTNHKTYVQNMSGIYTKIQFPYIGLLLNQWTYGEVTKAELWVYPPAGTYRDGSLPLADTISAYASDVYDNVTALKSSSNVALTGNLHVDKSNHIDTRYTYDITSFIQSIIAKTGSSQEFLLLKIPNGGAPRMVVFGDQNYTNYNYRIKLKIYYTHYDSY